MSLFVWKPEYSVNEAVLDSHHQKLFSILNSVYENVMNSPEVGCVLPKIEELSAFTRYHFATEELYMGKMEFSGIADHVAEHREFTRTMETLQASYHNNDLDVSRELIILLGEWLLGHVLKEDRKYSEFSNSTGE